MQGGKATPSSSGEKGIFLGKGPGLGKLENGKGQHSKKGRSAEAEERAIKMGGRGTLDHFPKKDLSLNSIQKEKNKKNYGSEYRRGI